MNTYGKMVKEGDTGVGCEFRAMERVRATRAIMVHLVGEPEIAHHDHAFPCKVDSLGRESHECDWRCKTVWPEWVTDEMFHLAARLACETATRRGAYNRGYRPNRAA